MNSLKAGNFKRKEFAHFETKFFPSRIAPFEKGLIHQRSKPFFTGVIFLFSSAHFEKEAKYSQNRGISPAAYSLMLSSSEI